MIRWCMFANRTISKEEAEYDKHISKLIIVLNPQFRNKSGTEDSMNMVFMIVIKHEQE